MRARHDSVTALCYLRLDKSEAEIVEYAIVRTIKRKKFNEINNLPIALKTKKKISVKNKKQVLKLFSKNYFSRQILRNLLMHLKFDSLSIYQDNVYYLRCFSYFMN